MEDKLITSKSKTIGMPDARKLLEATNMLKLALTEQEFIKIMIIYAEASTRLLKENHMD